MAGFFDTPLFVLDLANNHQGDVEHGLAIINHMDEARAGLGHRCAIKLQYRHLDTFIHPAFTDRMDIKYVKRFSETRLSNDDFKRLRDRMGELGFVSMCTPFDERSVDLIEEHDFEVIKVASCSLTDWPLLERLGQTNKPIVASTGGATADQIDKVVLFFQHREKEFALMHCVSVYPTENAQLEMNQIDFLRERYPNVPIGFSTHEHPHNMSAVMIAVGKGARLFEKHVGLPTDEITLNGYSANPPQVREWMTAASAAFEMCGKDDGERHFGAEESKALEGLRRGVFVSRDIAAGERIEPGDLFYAIPKQDGQLAANDISKYTVFESKNTLDKDGALMRDGVQATHLRDEVLRIVKKVSDILIESRTALPNRLDLELSHHYGIEKFDEVGATIITIVNREYCKKLLVMLPNQQHPTHHHARKTETFHVLYGDFHLCLDGEEKTYGEGEIITIEPGNRHSFVSKKGAVIEEISSTHYKDDSFYEDEKVNQNSQRKTYMTFWRDWLDRPAP